MSQKSTNDVPNRAFISREGWFAFRYPDGWEVDEKEDSVAVYDPERGVGALHISAYKTPGLVNPSEELLDLFSDKEPSVKGEDVKVMVEGTKKVASLEQVKNHSFQKTWLVSDNSFAVLVTYDCEDQDKDAELAKVENIVRSIEIAPKFSRN